MSESQCKLCGEMLKLIPQYVLPDGRELFESVTAVGFSSPEGHDHDDNCRKRRYECSKGHGVYLSVINKCHKCEWSGKTQCFCSTKVTEWPETVEAK